MKLAFLLTVGAIVTVLKQFGFRTMEGESLPEKGIHEGEIERIWTNGLS